MAQVLKIIRDFEQIAIALCLTFCTVSLVARLAWSEYKRWRSLNNSRKSKRNISL